MQRIEVRIALEAQQRMPQMAAIVTQEVRFGELPLQPASNAASNPVSKMGIRLFASMVCLRWDSLSFCKHPVPAGGYRASRYGYGSVR